MRQYRQRGRDKNALCAANVQLKTAFYRCVSVNHAENQGLRFSGWLLIGGKKKSAVLQYSVCLLALLGLFACQMVPVHLFCRCGVPPFDGEMTQKELRLSLIHPARHYEVYYLTKIIYWPITWSALLGKLFHFGPHQELFLFLFYALAIFLCLLFHCRESQGHALPNSVMLHWPNAVNPLRYSLILVQRGQHGLDGQPNSVITTQFS